MKKLITLLLVLTGCVMTANAKKLYVCLKAGETDFFPNANARIIAHLWGATGDDVKMIKELKYGEIWYSVELNGNTNVVIVRQDPNYGNDTSIDFKDGVWAKTGDITGLSTTNDTYGELWYDSSKKTYGVDTSTGNRPKTQWDGLACRNTIDGWTVASTNMETSDNNTFTRTFTKAEVSAGSLNAGDKFYFHFKHTRSILFDVDGNVRNGWQEIHTPSDTEMKYGNNPETVSQTNVESGNSWYVIIPAYDYEKIVFTAQYYNNNGTYKWKISADAYITKTVSGTNKYATLGCSVPLEIIEANSVTAHPLTANASTGKITKGSAFTQIPANQGALLENSTGSDQTIRAQVLASLSPSVSNNLVATSGTSVAKVTETGYTNYILASQNSHVGFYMVNSAGNNMGANTAYLHVADAVAGARAFFGFDETTGIEAIESNPETAKESAREYYNLNGQRVMNPTKGLYIVNGKKVIMK